MASKPEIKKNQLEDRWQENDALPQGLMCIPDDHVTTLELTHDESSGARRVAGPQLLQTEEATECH
jgi:hypothetical protein